jgi:hypothetical protein
MLFGLAAFLTINAQSNPGLGIKGGLNYNIRFNFLSEDQSLMAFHGGVNIFYPISNYLTLQSEIILSQKGEKWFEEIMKGKYRLTYIDVPLLLLFHPTPNNPFFNIQAGPQIGYLIRAKDIVENELENDKGKRDIKERYKDFDIGLAIGFEFNFPFHVNLTLRYIHGLSVVSDFYGKEIKNYVLQVSAGYRLFGK